MNKETLRMQMLSGIITESEYKDKLKENVDAKAAAEEAKELLNNPEDFKKAEAVLESLSENDGEVDNEQEKTKLQTTLRVLGYGALAGLLSTVPALALAGASLKVILMAAAAGKLLGAGITSTVSKLSLSNESLNENFVGMGMVGNIFDREKTDYELAFEHFTKGTSLNEVEADKESLKEIDYKSLADVDKETSISSLKSNLYYYGYAPMALQYSDDKDDSYILNDLKKIMKNEMKKRGYTENPTIKENSINFIQGDETVKNQLKTYFEEMARNYPENLASVLTGLVMGEDPTFEDFVSRVSNDISGDDNPFGLD